MTMIMELDGLYICDPPKEFRRPSLGGIEWKGRVEITEWINEHHPGQGWLSDYDVFFVNWSAAFHYAMRWL